MRRTVPSFVVAVILALVAFAATPTSSGAATLVGIGEQDASIFTHPLFTQLRVKRARVFPPWDAALRSRDRRNLDLWMNAARAAGVEPLVSFNPSTNSRCPRRPCRLPSVGQYSRAFRAFRRRYPFVRVVNPWNEANHRSQPTFASTRALARRRWRGPRRAAQYFNAVRRLCRGCTIIAADVIDEVNMVAWLRVFKRYARGERIWGLHNYRDTNPRRGQIFGGTRKLLRAVRGQVWLLETGGIVTFRLPGGRTLFPTSERRANTAIRRMFRLARRYRRRIKRLYIYNWVQPAQSNRFDAGLIRRNGTPRPAYFTVQQQLGTRFFNP
jgi:hypothetical protein